MEKKLRIGLIGYGARGRDLLPNAILPISQTEVTAVCDRYPDRAEEGAQKVEELRGTRPAVFTDYRELLQNPQVDAVIVAASWEAHVPITLDAMRAGKIVGCEVGGAFSVEECWELVRTQEATGTPVMLLENCCYGRDELMVLNMVKQGLFGEIVHCQGGYRHDLRNEVAFGRENRHYRFANYLNRNCENYPTHDLGPIAKILGINRGNRMLRLVSVASKARGLAQYVRDNKPDDTELLNTEFRQGDIVTTVITCENGETITLTLDTTLPRIYSRNFTVHGTKGMYQEDGDYVFLEKDLKVDIAEIDTDPQKIWKNADKYAETYDNDLWKHKSAGMLASGHGGMDYLVLRAMLSAARGESYPAIDVYDAAAWMSITALSERSIANGNMPVEIPDFTKGKYRNRSEKSTGKYALDF